MLSLNREDVSTIRIDSPTIMAAIVAGIVTIFGIVVNTLVTILINNKNNKSQEKLLKDRIQADVTSSSRIRWIEEVRRTCADYIASLIDYYYDYSNENKKENFIKLTFKMKLYFPINFEDNMSIKEKEDEQNMREFADAIVEEARKAKETNHNKHIQRTIGNNVIKKFISYKNGNVGKSPFISMMFDNNLEMMLKNKPKEKKKDEAIGITMDVISSYLKIEWDRAKENK